VRRRGRGVSGHVQQCTDVEIYIYGMQKCIQEAHAYANDDAESYALEAMLTHSRFTPWAQTSG
jgi:hypothetical protein